MKWVKIELGNIVYLIDLNITKNLSSLDSPIYLLGVSTIAYDTRSNKVVKCKESLSKVFEAFIQEK
jgi:hypothetical protein